MKKRWNGLLSGAFCLLIFCAAAWFTATDAMAAEKITPESSSILLTMETGAPSGDADSRVIRLMNIPGDFDQRYTTRWTSFDEAVATVSPNGTVQAVAEGQTMVCCEISRFSTGKLCGTVTVDVTVQAGGGGVAITGAPEGNTMSVGDTYGFRRNMDERCGVEPTNRTVWEISDSAVASVDRNGVVTAMKEGTFTIWARTFDEKGNLTAVSEGVTVTVSAGITAVKQLSANSIEVTLASGGHSLQESDFTIKEADGTLLGIETVLFSGGGQKVILETFAPFRDGESYTVAAGDFGSFTFTANVGEVDKVEIVTRYVKAEEGIEIRYVLYNDEEKQLYEGSGTENVLVEGDRVELLSSDDDAWIDGMELTIYDVDETAAVTVRYYPTGEGTYVESKPMLITAVEDDREIASVGSYTISMETDGSSASWQPVQTTVRVGERDRYLHLSFRDKDGALFYTHAEEGDGWFFTSANPEILGVDSDTGKLTPFAEGHATVYCVHNDFEFSASVSVKAAAKPAVLKASADKTTLSVAGSSDTAQVLVTAQDAAGAAVPLAADAVSWSFVSGGSTHPDVTVRTGDEGIHFTVTATDATAAGQHNLQIRCGEVKTTVTFTVSKSSASEQIDVTGGVIWYTGGMELPSSVALTLYADGTAAGTVEITAAEGWKHTWTGLGKNGAVYTVKAEAPSGWYASREDEVTTAIYAAEITGASAVTDGSGNTVITVTFTGNLASAEAAGIMVTGGTVQSVSLSGNTLVLNMGTLTAGSCTVTGTGIYGAASVTVAAG